MLPLLNGLEHMDVLRAHFANVVAAAIGHFEGYRESPTRIVQQTPGIVNVAATEAPEQLERAGIATRAGGSETDVLWEKLARQAPIAVLTSVTGETIGELRDRPAAAPAQSRKRARSPRPTAPGRRSTSSGRSSSPCRTGPRRPRNATSPPGGPRSSTRSAARWSARAADSAFPHLPSKRLLAHAQRDRPHRRALGLRAGRRQEHPPACRPPAARVRDRDGSAVGRMRARRRLHRLRGDCRRRALVRRRRPVPPARGLRDVDLARHRVDRVHAGAAARAVRPLRHRQGDEPLSRPGCRAARPRAAPRHAGGRLCARSRAREAAPGEDVAAGRRRPHDDAAARPVSSRRGVARRPVPGAAARLSPEQCARDRVDEGRHGDTHARGPGPRPLLTEGLEGFNVDDEADWERAEALVASGEATLTEVDRPPYPYPDRP